MAKLLGVCFPFSFAAAVIGISLLAAPAPSRAAARVEYPGLQQLTFRQGPIMVEPGQNSLASAPAQHVPERDGYITRFSYSVVYADSGRPVAANVLHLHHAGWSIDSQPAFPAGAEMTTLQFPRGFGFRVRGGAPWAMLYMLHNLTATPARVFIQWKVDYLPTSRAEMLGMRALSTQSITVVERPINNPVFTALRGSGKKGRLVAPRQLSASAIQGSRLGRSWRAPAPITLVYTTAHMHPGGLFSDLWVRRDGRDRLLFRSRAKYFGGQGKPSASMSQTETPSNWRIQLRTGDLLFITTAVDTSKASWHDTMGTFPLMFSYGHNAGGIDPFAPGVTWPVSGPLNHGPLPAASVTGGAPSGLPDPRLLPEGPRVNGPVAIRNFRYQLGDLENPGITSRPPVVEPGQRLTFVNMDYQKGHSERVYTLHTISACKAPCNYSTGLAYPLADSPTTTTFDSGQLGMGSLLEQPSSAQRASWQTPANLPEGTYTFFCRLHPFMRGAFRVASPARRAWSSGWSALPRGASSG